MLFRTHDGDRTQMCVYIISVLDLVRNYFQKLIKSTKQNILMIVIH